MSMLRDIGESVGNAVLENVGRAMGRAQERTPLPVDLLESDDAYLAVFDAPGARSTDVQVQYRDRTVEVRLDRFRGFHDGFEMRYPGRGLSLDGEVTLPADANVDPTAATATIRENGTLEVRVPKATVATEAEEWERKTDTEEQGPEDEHADVDDVSASEELDVDASDVDESESEADEAPVDDFEGDGTA